MTTPPPSELRDCFGRDYQVGPTAELLTGRSRSWQLVLPLAAMAAAGVLQYSFGALVPTLSALHGWSTAQTCWLLALWIVAQAGVGLPVAYLRERGVVGPVALVMAGAALCLTGPVALGHAPSYLGALLGFSLLGGAGAGLVYAVSASTVAKWFPDRSAVRVSLVTGAFACGAVPFLLFVFPSVTTANLVPVLDGTGLALGLVIAAAGLFFRDPPSNWWPPHVDPRDWALSRRRGPGSANLPAVREYSPGEAVRDGALPALAVILFCASAVTLFTVASFAAFAAGMALSAPVIGAATALLVAANGAARAVVLRVSDRIGRARTLAGALTVLALSQLALAASATDRSLPLLLTAAVLAGAGGACYPMVASLVREYFGDRRHGEIHAVVYSAKAFGGIAGVGLTALAVPTSGYPVLFLLAGGLALCSALLCRRLRQPGRIPLVWTTQRVR
ncbi:MFS transporter [Crossiella sp. CA-258035]|uniref:MFS transporter n=1 Tax=Crossiella sp. CA-258035 TaxID=2981138 RepID=UPI0024BD0B2C|nr:MFS transporter [Crossiella sp. CA-258035]WHT22274.1 MFS transporter [Crossiella sp. CA-258035]